jgi:hypothetical protein
METALLALLGVLVGAIANNFGGEYYKRHRDRSALALGLAGEIQATIWAVEHGGLLGSGATLAALARQNQDVNLPPLPAQRDFVYETLVASIGLLPGDLPERLALYYGYLKGARRVNELISEGFFGKTGDRLARVIEMQVSRWNTTIAPLGKQLVVDLKPIGSKTWIDSLREDCRW